MKILHGFSEKEPMHSLLRASGLEPVHVPFLEHEGVHIQKPKAIPEVVLVSSARTIRYWGAWGEWIRQHAIRVVAISSKTQQALEAEGIPSYCAKGTGDQLVRMLDMMDCASFVHIGAQELSSKLDASLLAQQRPYIRVPVYRSYPNPHFDVGVDVVLGCLNSERCAKIWSIHAPLIPAVCIGETTKAKAIVLGLDVLGVANTPTRESLVDVAVSASRKMTRK